MGLVFANNTSATVSSGGTTTSDTSWTISASGFTGFPVSLAAGQYFHVADPVAPGEKIRVTAISGSGPYTWTVTRGDESTTAAAHTSGFTVQQVVTAGDFSTMLMSAALPSVKITLSSPTFTPSVTLYSSATATVYWAYNGAIVASGVNPTITGAASGSWTCYMYAIDPSGYSALDQIQIFNIGYASLDAGPWSPSSSYNYTAQPVTAIKDLNAMTKLQWFLAEEVTGLAGTLNFSGMSSLTVADMHCADGSPSALTGVNLSGCTSLQRLSVEACNLTALDLNPVAACLRDLRCALQTGGALTFKPLTAPLIGQYHFCARDQVVGVSQPLYKPNLNETAGALTPQTPIANLDTWAPNIAELWHWNTGQYGALSSTSPFLRSVEVNGNWYASANFAGAFLKNVNSGFCELDMHANQLTSVNITGCAGLGDIILNHNPLTQAQVDTLLAQVDAYGTSSGTLDLSNTAAPSATGLTHKTNLTGRGWTVTTDSSGAPGGGFGNKFTYGESVISRYNNGTSPLQAKLALPGNSGDLLVAAIQAGATPTLQDTAGNTWTVLGPYNSDTYLAYCLSAASAPGGLTVTSSTGYCVAVSRFVPHGTVTYGSVASATAGGGGYGQNTSNNMGSLGTVAADALAWGVFFDADTGPQTYSGGFQSGGSGTPSFVGAAWQSSGTSTNCPQGSAVIIYVPGCANAATALTWNGNGTGANGHAVSAYFTST